MSSRKTQERGPPPKELIPKVSAESILRDCSRCGKLNKQGAHRKNWKTRFAILSKGKLYYFKGKKDKLPKGFVEVYGTFIEEDFGKICGKDFAFKVWRKWPGGKGNQKKSKKKKKKDHFSNKNFLCTSREPSTT